MLSGLILAGGRSSRMGRDKATLKLPDGKTLLERQAGILRAAGATRLFASIKPSADYRLGDITPVHDAVADAGPLAGIAGGLAAAPAGLLIVVAVDMPGVQPEHLRQLVSLASADRGVVPVHGGQSEPLAAIYPTKLAASAQAALVGGLTAVHAWARGEAARGKMLMWETPEEWAGVFHSWNTPGDIRPNA